MRKLLAIVLVMTPSLVLAQQTTKPPSRLTLYKTADSAACSGDAVVWLDSDSLVYYLKGDKSFGKTKHGGYNCRKQADAAGYHAFRSH